MKETNSTLQKWLDLAYADFQSTKHLLTLYPTPTEVICYLCEQSAEKYLKAFLLKNNEEPPKTHDLMKLNRLSQNHDSSFSTIMEPCTRLTPYGTHVRYPNNIEVLDEDMNLAIVDIEKIIEFITAKL